MPEPVFRGDPYAVLDVDASASSAQIKRRWRELAREHHPDVAGGGADEEAERRTTRMARINAAYDLLRDPVRRASYDASPGGRRARARSAAPTGAAGTGTRDEDGRVHVGPPPPPRSRPVTARYDTSAAFKPRNATTSATRSGPLRGHPPRERGTGNGQDLRASTPTGPVRSRRSPLRVQLPSLEEARATPLEFGRHHGRTLGEVAETEPTYVDWIAKTITRDRDLVIRARVVQSDLDARGVERAIRETHPGFGYPGGADE